MSAALCGCIDTEKEDDQIVLLSYSFSSFAPQAGQNPKRSIYFRLGSLDPHFGQRQNLSMIKKPVPHRSNPAPSKTQNAILFHLYAALDKMTSRIPLRTNRPDALKVSSISGFQTFQRFIPVPSGYKKCAADKSTTVLLL